MLRRAWSAPADRPALAEDRPGLSCPDVLFGARGGRDKLAGRRAPYWRPEPGGVRFRLLTRGSDANRAGAELGGRFPDLVTHEEIAAGRPGFLLIRPDGYVGASGGPQDLLALEHHLDGIRPKAVTGG